MRAILNKTTKMDKDIFNSLITRLFVAIFQKIKLTEEANFILYLEKKSMESGNKIYFYSHNKVDDRYILFFRYIKLAIISICFQNQLLV